MKKAIGLIFFLMLGYQLSAQESKDSISVEYLKPIEISKKKQNEYTGKYTIVSNPEFVIEVELTDSGMKIIIPEMEKSANGMTTTRQYSMQAQYEDKFYLTNDAFVKIHFTRSKRTKKVISLLFNANRAEGKEAIRAIKAKE